MACDLISREIIGVILPVLAAIAPVLAASWYYFIGFGIIG